MIDKFIRSIDLVEYVLVITFCTKINQGHLNKSPNKHRMLIVDKREDKKLS